MKVVAASDWRESLPFETPMIVAAVLPGDPARCSVCGADSDPLPRTELWAVRHRHPKHHDGHVRFYCGAHLPVIERPAPAPAAVTGTRARPVREPRAPRAAPRRTAEEKPRAICPDCFVEVPPNGVCGICGQAVA